MSTSYSSIQPSTLLSLQIIDLNKKLDREKHSSLPSKSFNETEKRFFNIGAKAADYSQDYETV
jgi:hypothetical protein